MHEIAARGAPVSRLAAKRMCITAQSRVPRFHSRLPLELTGHFQNIVFYLEHPMSKKRKTPDDDGGGGSGGGGELASAEDFPRSSCADQGMQTRTLTGGLTKTFDREPVTAGDVTTRKSIKNNDGGNNCTCMSM